MVLVDYIGIFLHFRILLTYDCVQKMYIGKRLLPVLVYEYNDRNDDRLLIQEAEHHMSRITFTYYMKTNSDYDK